MKRLAHRLCAFSLLELLLILAVIAMLLLLLVPGLAKVKERAQRIECTDHLKQILLSYRQWTLDGGDEYQMQVSVTNGGVLELIEADYFESTYVVLSNKLITPKVLWCPAAKKPQAPAAFERGLGPTNVNYFIGLDAVAFQPQMFLSGDDNWLVDGKAVTRGVFELTTNNVVGYSSTRHKLQGNVGLSDGSVQGYSSTRLQEALRYTGTNVNRIAFP